MKRVFLSAFFTCLAALLWSCDYGAVEAKGLEDEMALLNYGEFNEDGMSNLIPAAMAACNEDPQCVAAMERAAGEGGEIFSSSEGQQDGSGSGADSSAQTVSSSSTPKGPVIASSSAIIPDITPTSSSDSAGGSSSSAAVVSSSSKSTTPIVNGICSPTPASVERGGSTTWKYVAINSSVTIESYDWTFDEGSSIASSKDATPAVTYAAKGSYGAAVVINKGLATEKEVKCQSKVEVTGIKVSGCTCTTPTKSLVVSSSKSKEATWTVSGCTGAEPFTYAWGGGISGTGTSGTMTISAKGTYTPTVTVTNSDGMTMSPTCNSVTASELPGAQCVVGADQNAVNNSNSGSISTMPGQSFVFKAKSVTGVSGSMTMDLTIGNGTPKEVTIISDNNWGTNETSLKAPSELRTYPITLSADGEEVCSASLTVEYPKVTASCSFASSVLPGGSVNFNVGSLSGWADAMGNNASMVLSGNGSSQNITVNRSYNGGFSITAPTELGSYDYTLTYGGNQVCKATMKVEYPAITSTGCAIGKKVWNSGKDFFTPGANSFSGWGSAPSPQKMTLYFGDEILVENQDVTNGYNTPQWQQVTLPTEPGTYTYRLDYHGNTVCEVEYEVE